MEKVKEKLTTIKLEILFIIVLLAIVIIAGLAIFTMATKNKNIDNFKEDAKSILSVAKNIYPALEKTNNTDYIHTSDDGTSKAVCITITGLEENDYLTKKYKNWNGYVVVEKTNNEYTYTLWGTNKKYVYNEIDLLSIEKSSVDKEITKYQKEEFERSVKTSFKGKNDKRYYGECISKKID